MFEEKVTVTEADRLAYDKEIDAKLIDAACKILDNEDLDYSKVWFKAAEYLIAMFDSMKPETVKADEDEE